PSSQGLNSRRACARRRYARSILRGRSMRPYQRQAFFALLFGVVLSGTTAAHAQTSTTSRFQVLLDTDRNATTGCSVTTNGGRFDGAEMIVTTTVVTAGQVSSVTSVARQTCTDPATATFS